MERRSSPANAGRSVAPRAALKKEPQHRVNGAGANANSKLIMTATETRCAPAGEIQLLHIALGEHAQQLIPVGRDKRPIHAGWQEPHRQFTIHQLTNAPAIGLRLGHSGVIAADFDPPADDPAAGDRTFQKITGRSSAELPPSWSWTSGRPGRRQVALLVPTEWRQRLKSQQHQALEFRWTGQQSVIAGAHPETGRYRWVISPWDSALAVAPDWLLQAIAPAPPQLKPAPQRPPTRCVNWTPADACRYYLQWWPAEGLAFADWWATIVAMRRAGLSEAEAFAWTSASSKHKGGREFRRQWQKAASCPAPFTVAWLGAQTKRARERRQ